MEFIIKQQKCSNRTIRMPDKLINEIKELADREDVSFNQIVVQCCQFALKNLSTGKQKNP